MNLIRSLLKPFNRRVTVEGVKVERRGTTVSRLDAATARVEDALDELNKTVSMSRDEFFERMLRDKDCTKEKQK